MKKKAKAVLFFPSANRCGVMQDHSKGDQRKRKNSIYTVTLDIRNEVGYAMIIWKLYHLFSLFVAIHCEKASSFITYNNAFTNWIKLFHYPKIVITKPVYIIES